MGCFSKTFLFILNLLVFLLGVAVIALASLIISDGNNFQVLISEGTMTIPIVLLIFGICVMLLGFFGCFGALRESPCLLYTYATIVLVLFIAQLVVAIYALTQREQFNKFVSEQMVKSLNKYGGDEDVVTQALDNTQHQLECCGVHNYTDWYSGVLSGAKLTSDVPIGCCKNVEDSSCNFNIKGVPLKDLEDKIFTKGCFTMFTDIVDGESLWLIIGVIVLALVQVCCITIACGIGRRSGHAEV